jgi:hypothetical protein
MMRTAKWAARIGAVFYVFWGVFHLVAANAVYGLAEQSTGMVRARLLQDAFYLLFFAVAGILMAVILNWRNDKRNRHERPTSPSRDFAAIQPGMS